MNNIKQYYQNICSIVSYVTINPYILGVFLILLDLKN